MLWRWLSVVFNFNALGRLLQKKFSESAVYSRCLWFKPNIAETGAPADFHGFRMHFA